MTVYGAIKRAYRTVAPRGLRDWVYRRTPSALQPFRTQLIRRLEAFARHDEIYDREYYETLVEPTMRISARVMAESICEHFQPETAVDVGCGTGALMEQMQQCGVQMTGFEYALAAVKIARGRALNVVPFDIERDDTPPHHFDLALSTEVAEHLPPACADRFVDLMSSLSGQVVLTAAMPSEVPGAHGTDHVNEQPNEYWISKFQGRGYSFNRDISSEWRREWQRLGVAHCFYSSVMVFSKRGQRQGASV